MGSDEKNPIKMEHAGENPLPAWPNRHPHGDGWEWGADKIVEDMEACQRCSRDHGACDYHRGLVEGYSKGRMDVFRIAQHSDDAAITVPMGDGGETMQDIRDDINEIAGIGQGSEVPGYFNNDELSELARFIAEREDAVDRNESESDQ